MSIGNAQNSNAQFWQKWSRYLPSKNTATFGWNTVVNATLWYRGSSIGSSFFWNIFSPRFLRTVRSLKNKNVRHLVPDVLSYCFLSMGTKFVPLLGILDGFVFLDKRKNTHEAEKERAIVPYEGPIDLGQDKPLVPDPTVYKNACKLFKISEENVDLEVVEEKYKKIVNHLKATKNKKEVTMGVRTQIDSLIRDAKTARTTILKFHQAQIEKK